jgi:hypothetical protein
MTADVPKHQDHELPLQSSFAAGLRAEICSNKAI